MKSLLPSRGQGAVEAVIALPLMILVGTAFILLLYRGLIYYFSDYHLHEALLCAEALDVRLCEKELKARLQTVLITQTHGDVALKKRSSETVGKISISLTPPLVIEKKLKRRFP